MAKYNEKELADTSKFLSFVLRHKPEAIGIVLNRADAPTITGITKTLFIAGGNHGIQQCNPVTMT